MTVRLSSLDEVEKYIWVPVVRLEGKLCNFPAENAARLNTLPAPPTKEGAASPDVDFTEHDPPCIILTNSNHSNISPRTSQTTRRSSRLLTRPIQGRICEQYRPCLKSKEGLAKEVEQAVEGRVVNEEEVAAQKSEVGSKTKTEPGQMEDLLSNEFAGNDNAKF